MLTEERKLEIQKQAVLVNSESEKYQLVHACSAIEKILKNQLHAIYQQEFSRLRKAIREESDVDKREQYMQEAKELMAESNKRVRIAIEYLEELNEDSARTTRTKNNLFTIVLPKCMQEVRGIDGHIDVEKMKSIRRLMAHELGHILLHAGSIMPGDQNGTETMREDMEEEADWFADELIKLRQERNREIYNNDNYTKF